MDLLADLRPEMEHLFGSASASDVVLEPGPANGVQEGKHSDEIRFTRPVRADNDVNRRQGKLLDGLDTPEAMHRDVVECFRRH